MWQNLSTSSIDPHDAQLYGADVYSIVNPDTLSDLNKKIKDKIKNYHIENRRDEISQPLNEFMSLVSTNKKNFKCFCNGGQIPINKVIGVDSHYRNLSEKIANFNKHRNDLPIPRPKFISFLNIELFLLLQHLSPTNIESKSKIFVFNQILLITKSLFPNSTLTLYGSSNFHNNIASIGTCLPGSDLNLMLSTQGDEVLNLKLLAYILVQFDILQCFEYISKDIYLIKGVHKIKGHIISISINTSLDSHYYIVKKMDEYKYIKPLIIFMKFYLQSRNLGDSYTGGTGSYLLNLMTIHFIENHESTINSKFNTTLGDLIIDFFHFWGYRFNYEKLGISLVEGSTVYTKRSKDKRLSLLDPFNNDIGSRLTNYSAVKTAFQSGFKILKSSENDYFYAIKNEFTPLGAGWIRGNTIIERIFDPQHPFFQHRKIERINIPIMERYKIFSNQDIIKQGEEEAIKSLENILEGDDVICDLNHVPYNVAALKFTQTFEK